MVQFSIFSFQFTLFVLLFKSEGDRNVHTGYYIPKLEIKYYNIMIDGKKRF